MRNQMRTRYAPFAALLAGLIILAGWTMMPRMDIQPESRIWVEGTSTIHDWKMTVGKFDGAITAAADQIGAVEVTVPVKQLDADNGTMNKKAHSALKADKHPNITYRLTTAALKSGTNAAFEVSTEGQLTIAGVTKPVTFTVKGEQLADGKYRYVGSTSIKMSDYGVDAPSAMLGTIKTGDKVVVHFDVVVN